MKLNITNKTLLLILASLLVGANPSVFSDQTQDAINQAENTKRTNHAVGDVKKDPPKDGPRLKHVSENGGEVLIDGSLRVYEPIYGKNIDLVEISTSVKPLANHVRLYAVASGSYTVLKAQFDDGQEAVVTHN